MSGSSEKDGNGFCGDVRQFDSNFWPGARYSASLTNVVNGTAYLFGGEGKGAQGAQGGHMNELWAYRQRKFRHSGEWAFLFGATTIASPSGNFNAPPLYPGGRIRCSAWYSSSETAIYIFGGGGKDGSDSWGDLGDLWRFSTSTLDWTFLKGGSARDFPSNYGTKNVASVSNVPGSLENQMTFHSRSDSASFYVFGGQHISHFSALWKYETTSNTWIWMNGPSLSSQNSVGGVSGEFHDFYSPGSRIVSAVMDAPTKDIAYVYGGYGYSQNSTSSGILGDLWGYDKSIHQWAYIAGESRLQGASVPNVRGAIGKFSSEYHPSSRWYVVGWSDPNSILIYLAMGQEYDSSTNPTDRCNDVWGFNSSALQWSWVGGDSVTDRRGVYSNKDWYSAINKPGSRTGPSTTVDNEMGVMYCFGGNGYGATSSSEGGLNDLWATRGPTVLVPTATASPTPSSTPSSSPTPTATPTTSPTPSPTSSPTASPSPSPPPQLFSIEPPYGPVTGTTAIRLIGKQLQLIGETNVTIVFEIANQTQKLVPGKRVSSSIITCASPAFTYPMNATITVRGTAGELVCAEKFKYYGNLTLTGVRPSLAPLSGGTSVLVEGTNIPNTGSYFVIRLRNNLGNDSNATVSSYCDTTGIFFVSPPLNFYFNATTCQVVMEVAPNGQQFVPDQQLAFTYYKIPSVDAVTPTQVMAHGGMNVTVTGSGFFPSYLIQCSFGIGSQSSGYYISSSAAHCLVPAVTNPRTVPVEISMDGGNRFTSSGTARLMMIEFVSEKCRRSGELPTFKPDREQLGLQYFENLAIGSPVTTSDRRDNYDSSVGRALNPSQLVDGDRCCEYTLQTHGYKCGTVFDVTNGQTELASVIVDLKYPAYVDEVLTTWFRPCKNLPDPGYTIEAEYNGTWSKILERAVWKENPCRTVTGDNGPTAFCADFFSAIVARRFKLTFNNTAEHFLVGSGTDGGWLMEFEVHGIFLKTPYQLKYTGYSLSVKSDIRSVVPPMHVESLNIQRGSTNASDPLVSRAVSLSLIQASDSKVASCLESYPTVQLQGYRNFSDVVLLRPKVGTYTLFYRSSGLQETNVTIVVVQGDAVALHANWTAGETSVKASANSVLLDPITVHSIDEGSNDCTTEDVARNVTITCNSSELSGTIVGTMKKGSLQLSNIKLLNPTNGVHTLQFHSSGLRSVLLYVPIGVGEPAQVQVEHQSNAPIPSAEHIDIPSIYIKVLDAGGTWVTDASVRIDVDLVAGSASNILGGNTTVTSTNGLAKFNALTLKSPKSGIYTLRFTSPSITGSLPVFANVSVISGPPAGIVIVEGPTSIPYPCISNTLLNPVSARLLDAGGELIDRPASDVLLYLKIVRHEDPSNVVVSNVISHVNATTGTANWTSLNAGSPKIGTLKVIVSGILCGKERFASFTLNITNGPPVQFKTDFTPGMKLKGAAMVRIPSITITEEDAGENRASVAATTIRSVNVTLTVPSILGVEVLVGTRNIEMNGGQAVLSDLYLRSPKIEWSYELAINVSGLERSGINYPFSVESGPVAQLGAESKGKDSLMSENIAGRPIRGLPIEVSALDGARNPISGSVDIQVQPIDYLSDDRVSLSGKLQQAVAPAVPASFDDLVLQARRGMLTTLQFAIVGKEHINTNLSIEIEKCDAVMPGSIVNPESNYNCYCKAGYTPNAGLTKCIECSNGEYKENAGNGVCDQCIGTMQFTTSKMGATSVKYCKCRGGYYYRPDADPSKNGKCIECDFRMSECPGGDRSTEAVTKTTLNMGPIYPKSGYWKAASAQPWEILPCPGGNTSCIAVNGTSGTKCDDEYRGPLCSLCIDNYAKQGEICYICAEYGWNLTALIAAIIVIFFLGRFYVNKQMLGGRSPQATILKVIVSYVQILAFIGGFRARWKGIMSGFYAAVGSAANMEVMRLQPIDCLFRSDYYGTFFFFVGLIPVCFLLPLILYHIARLPCFKALKEASLERKKRMTIRAKKGLSVYMESRRSTGATFDVAVEEVRESESTNAYHIVLWPIIFFLLVALPGIPRLIGRGWGRFRKGALPKFNLIKNRVMGDNLGICRTEEDEEEIAASRRKRTSATVDDETAAQVRAHAKSTGGVLFEEDPMLGRTAMSATKGAFWIMFFFLLPTIMKNTMELFNCRQIGKERRVDRDLSVVCGTDFHNYVQVYGFWLALVPVVLLLVVYVIYKNVILRKRRQLVQYLSIYNLCWQDSMGYLRLPPGVDEETAKILRQEKQLLRRLRKYMFLFSGYRSDGVLHMWDLVIMVRKIAIAAILVFARHQVALQIFGALLIFVAALVLHMRFKPFDDEYARKKNMPVLPSTLEFVSILTTIFTLLCGFLFYLKDDEVLSEAALTSLDWLLMLVNAAVLVAFVYLLFSSVLHEASSKLGSGTAKLVNSSSSQGAARWWKNKVGCCSWGVKEESEEVGKEIQMTEIQLATTPASEPQPEKSVGLPAGWEEKIDEKSGKTYYVHCERRLTRWEKPIEERI